MKLYLLSRPNVFANGDDLYLIKSPPSVLYSFLAGPAYNACDKTKLMSITLDQMPDEIKKKALFDNEIQDRCTTSWISIPFPQFGPKADKEERETWSSLWITRKIFSSTWSANCISTSVYVRSSALLHVVKLCSSVLKCILARHLSAKSWSQPLWNSTSG